MSAVGRPIRGFLLTAALSGATGMATVEAQTAPYPKLDHVQGTLIQTAAAPVRPLWIDSTGDVWAVNTGLSTVERFRTVGQPALDRRQVPWGPVSITEWDDPAPGVGPELLIVCRNTWGVLRMDRDSGAHKEFIPVPAEPSDVVVDATNSRAFVSCTGADAVVEIDLTQRNGRFHRRWDESTTDGKLRLKSPYFLSLVGSRVRVAPLHSGNNTTVTDLPFGRPRTVVKLSDDLPDDDDSDTDPEQRDHQLPDEDLFEITPPAPHVLPSPDSVEVLANAVGTILFAHGRNPLDGRYWMLNTDARNSDPLAQTEPALNFDFVDNRVTRLGPPTFTNFDPGENGYVGTTAIGQPFALTFHPTNGRALVAGLLTDNVTLLDAGAARLLEIDLPDGSIPRGLALTSTGVAVYCWGTGRVELYTVDLTQPSYSPTDYSHSGGYSLSFDPLPQDLKDGRRIFFDGALSSRQNVSCASCHVDGGTDFLAWNLSAALSDLAAPSDDKGPMVTQTLIGLERVAPFHWRGERTFEEFNERAFPGLLGHASLSPTDFEKMKAWLFQLRNPANPDQSRNRVVDGSTPSTQFVAPTQTRVFESKLPANLATLNPEHPFLQNAAMPNPATSFSAVQGLDDFQNDLVFQGRFTCVQCHAFPVGTDNDVTDDEGQGEPILPERLHFKNTPFHEIWRKKQSLVLADTQTPSAPQLVDVRTFLGTGVQHAGSVADVLRFTQVAAQGILNPVPAAVFALNVAPLMQQWDQGLAPAAHFGFLLDGTSTPGQVQSELQDFLLVQASSSVNTNPATPNCDIAVLQALAGGTRKTWYLDRALVAGTTIAMSDAVFSVDSATNPETRSMQSFVDQASTAPVLVLGLPVGMAERFAVDFDMDLRRNRDEAQTDLFVVNPVANGSPTITRQELGHVTTNGARVYVETDEPTTLTVTYTDSITGQVQTAGSPMLSRVHSVMLTNLRPSTPSGDPSVPEEPVGYTVSLSATDASNSPPTTTTLVGGVPATDSFNLPLLPGNDSPIDQIRHEHVLTAPPAVDVSGLSGGTRLVTVQLQAELKQGFGTIPAPNRVFVIRAYRQRAGAPLVQLTGNNGITSLLQGARLVNLVQLDDVDDGATTKRPLGVSGGMLLNSVASDANGAATIQFRVSSSVVTSNDTLLVNVEAVVEAAPVANPISVHSCSQSTPTCASATIRSPYLTGFSQWDVPRTTEDKLQGSRIVP